jgi:hypothetical protein
MDNQEFEELVQAIRASGQGYICLGETQKWLITSALLLLLPLGCSQGKTDQNIPWILDWNDRKTEPKDGCESVVREGKSRLECPEKRHPNAGVRG